MTSRGKGIYIYTSATSSVQTFSCLLQALVLRELKGRYRRSILGPTWAILQPLLYMVLFTFLRGALALKTPTGIPYPIFTFSVLVPWTFFANAISRATPSVYSNAGLVKKLSVSREVFPLSGVVCSFVDFLIASVILVAMMLYYRIEVSSQLCWLPLLILLTSLLAMGISLFISALGTYKRDIIIAVPFIINFWLFITPIMYPLERVSPKWAKLYACNPMVGLIEGFRNILIRSQPPDLSLLGLSLAGIIIVWLVAWPLFRHMSQYFADVL